MALTQRQLAECWRAYKTHRDEQSQEQLVQAYLPLVKRTVARIKPIAASVGGRRRPDQLRLNRFAGSDGTL